MAKKKEPFNQAEYIREYQKDFYYRVNVVLSRKYDKDLIDHLQTKKSKSDYIKQLIRNDMNRNDDSEEWPE